MRRLLACLALALSFTLWPQLVAAQATRTELQQASSTTDTDAYTFASQNLGTATADRCIVVSVHARKGAGGTVLDTVTIAGVSATIFQDDFGSTTISAIAVAAVPTGTSGDVVVDFNSTQLRAAIGMWAMTGADCTVFSDTAFDDGTDPTTTIDVPANGVAFAACTVPQTTTATWTGLTEDYDTTVETTLTHSGASAVFGTTQTGLTVTCDTTGTTDPNMVVVAFGPATSTATQTFLQAASSGSDLTTYTYSAQNLGTAAASRCIIAAVHGRASGATALTISSVTINGVTATIPVQLTEANTNADIAGLAIAAVPTGTSGDVVVVFSRALVRSAIALWLTTGLTCTAPPNDTDSSDVTNPSVALNVPANGFAIAACSFGGNSTSTWTGLTERYDASVESALEHTGSSADFATAQSGLTVTCDSGTTIDPVGVFASWGPTAAPPGGGGGSAIGILGGGVF